MRKIRVFPYPRVPWEGLQGFQPVVLDVLRATTTIIAALSGGADSVLPALSLSEARRLKRERPSAILGGERGGLRPTGFDLGNSPVEYRPQVVRGRPVVLATTNGTRAIRAAARLGPVWIAALTNGRALTAAVPSGPIAIILAGREGDLAAEDLLGAGHLVDIWSGTGNTDLDDLSHVARSYFRHSLADIRGALGATTSARHLSAMGLDADIAFAAAVDASSVVPVYREGEIRRFPPTPDVSAEP